MDSLFKLWAEAAILINFNAEISYSQDQAYISVPTVFPVVSFELLPTGMLSTAAYAKVRKDEDFAFYIGINGFTKTKLNNCIEFTCGDKQDTIDLTEEEQEIVFAVLDAQCKEKLGKGCDELLEEAKAEIE